MTELPKRCHKPGLLKRVMSLALRVIYAKSGNLRQLCESASGVGPAYGGDAEHGLVGRIMGGLIGFGAHSLNFP